MSMAAVKRRCGLAIKSLSYDIAPVNPELGPKALLVHLSVCNVGSVGRGVQVRVVVSSQGRPESVSVAPEQLALPPSGKGGSRKRQSAPSSLASEVQAVIHEHAVAQPEVSTDAGSGETRRPIHFIELRLREHSAGYELTGHFF